MTIKQFLCPLNKQLLISALSPDRPDITVSKIHSYGNGIDVFKIIKWVVRNKHNQTVFVFQQEKLKTSWRLTLKINDVDIMTENIKKQDSNTFLCKIEQLLRNKEHQQKFVHITTLARTLMSTRNGIVYDYLQNVL